MYAVEMHTKPQADQLFDKLRLKQHNFLDDTLSVTARKVSCESYEVPPRSESEFRIFKGRNDWLPPVTT